MATIVTRTGKGSALTHTELDANFTNINADIATKPSTVFTGVFTTPSPSALAVTDDVLLSVEPSLRLDFVNSRRLDPRVTFSRASTATRVNQIGLVETAASKVPRFDFDPVTKACRGLLIEESRTNLFTYSEQFDNAVWNKGLMLATGGYVSPSGSTNAYLIDTATETGAGYPAISTTVAAATYVLSVFIKAGTASHLRIRFSLSSGSTSIWYSVASKTFSNAGTGVTGLLATYYGSGWSRLSVSVTYGSSDVGARSFALTPAASAGSGTPSGTVFLWGAQLETGSFATSYIPSTGTQTTRAADSATVANISSWYNAVEGTILSSTSVSVPAAYTSYPYMLGSFNTGIMLYRQSDNQPVARVRDSSVDSFINGFGASWTTTAVNKNALAYESNNFASSNNSGTPAISSSGTVPSVSVLALGSISGTSGFLNGCLQNFIYYPVRLSDSTLQALTK